MIARKTKDFKSVIIEKAAKVVPIEKDPTLPTKILPWKLKIASENQAINGIYNNTALEPDIKNKLNITINGQTVSKPFKPPSWFIVLVITVIIKGIMKK